MLNKLSIAVVEDNPLQLILLERTLRKLGVGNIHTFDNGLEAVSWTAYHQVDTLLCDLQMPEMDGIDMLISLNEQGFKGNVILLSAMDHSVITAVRTMCDPFGFNVVGQLSKPYNNDELSNLLAVSIPSTTKQATSQRANVTEADFLVALAEGQIQNYYQPLVDFNSNNIIGVEALARWVHPTQGMLSPAVFMPIVERCSLSNELFDTVFGNAIADIKQRQLDCKVSLNVDHYNLKREQFSDDFLSRCNSQDIDPKRFTIEITETDTYSDSVELYRNLSKLRINGIGVSIDDFGTGHSSLKKLSVLPFNEIKIDRSFVQGLINEPKKNQIIYFICALAKSLSINIVAEGVEDKATWSTLKTYGVDVCQGFYHYRPMSISDLATLTCEAV
jgi:EAL domain-containing protein (putative c-di-GMP-specific phosphodiesterase class I)